MRTNTWLAFQMVQNEVNHWEDKAQRARIAAAQDERDRLRDEKYDRAAHVAQNGQFAMWIQTPEGQRYDRWERHAMAASQALADREMAWETGWLFASLPEAEGTELEEKPKDSRYGQDPVPTFGGVERPWERHPWHRVLHGDQMAPVATVIDDFVARSSATLPRPDTLPPLAGVYYSYPVDMVTRAIDLPDTLRELLKRFNEEDATRVEALHADRLR